MSGGRLVAIHQPNFFPWLGWFNKVAEADVLVLLDDVQFPKKGGTWTNRVKILLDGGEHWLTVPIVRSYHGTREIREIEIRDEPRWREKALGTLRSGYGSAPHFNETMPLLEELLSSREKLLERFNEGALRRLIADLRLDDTELVRSSDLNISGSGTARLIELTQAAGGSRYLAGGGAGGYQQDEEFGAAGVGLQMQAFSPPPYPQAGGPHVPGLSIIDALMYVGLEGCRALVRGLPVK